MIWKVGGHSLGKGRHCTTGDWDMLKVMKNHITAMVRAPRKHSLIFPFLDHIFGQYYYCSITSCSLSLISLLSAQKYVKSTLYFLSSSSSSNIDYWAVTWSLAVFLLGDKTINVTNSLSLVKIITSLYPYLCLLPKTRKVPHISF